MAIFRAYIDESANTEDTFFIVGGFVGHDDAWSSLEPKWLSALPPYLEYFHTTDCFTGGGQFKENEIDIPERVRLLDTLTDLVAEHDIRLIVCRLPTTRFLELAPKRANDFWGNRFVGLFPDVVRMACQYAIGPVSPPDPPKTTEHICHIWWEDNEYTDGAKEFIKNARKNPLFWWSIALGTHTYGDKKGPAKITLLQVADLGAFLGGKKAMNSPPGNKISWKPYYEKLEKAGRILQHVIVTEEELDKFYKDFLNGKQKAKTA